MSVDAVLQPIRTVALLRTAAPAAAALEAGSTDVVVNDSGEQIQTLQTLEHKLAVSYTLPNGEDVALPPVLSASAAVANTQAPAEAPCQLQYNAAHVFSVDEALVRSMAVSNAAMPLTLAYASRTTAAPDRVSPTPAANAASAGKAAKPAKAAAVPEEVPWMAAQQYIAPFDLAPLLVGQTEVQLKLPQKGLPMPVQLQAFSSVVVRLQVCSHLSSQIWVHACSSTRLTLQPQNNDANACFEVVSNAFALLASCPRDVPILAAAGLDTRRLARQWQLRGLHILHKASGPHVASVTTSYSFVE